MILKETEEIKIISDLSKMIQCKTVSNSDESLVNWAEFTKFQALLKKSFPNIYKNCDFIQVGKTGLIHKIKGSSDEKNHGKVLMAHYDVVPTDGQNWNFEPFCGEVVNGFIRGRGTLDTKSTLCACMEAVEFSLNKGWQPVSDLYLCFSGEEEINGNSCAEIVDWFIEQKIQIDFVLDEGGAIVENAFPGVKKRCAMIGTAEKGSTNIDLIIEGKPGHASTPPKNSIIGLAAKAVCKIEKASCKAEYTQPVKELFKVMGKNNSNIALKFLFSNASFTRPLISLASKLLGGELNALIHTTCAITKAKGSNAYNVLPSKAKIGMNLRLLGSDTVEKAKARIEKLAQKAAGKKARIKVEVINGNNPSKISDTKCTAWNDLVSVVHETWPEILISPYLMMACSDSRHYCRITDKVYRFCGMFLSKEERGMIHGENERISCETMIKTVEFYLNLLKII